ncbi:MAG TPA: hypothetical protein PKD64_18330 [Pirellulaceae bacterium]|nr:hypothetical protein [Pirellulaceae bacterium]HMP71162.1 hypothetical protein [Pirellulaceae bacterium]
MTDFWSADNTVACADRQLCLMHLLCELEHTLHYKSLGEGRAAFEKELRRLLGDAIRLWKQRDQLVEDTLISRRLRLEQYLQELIDTPSISGHAKRLIKRLRRHQQDLFPFLPRRSAYRKQLRRVFDSPGSHRLRTATETDPKLEPIVKPW